MKQLLISLLLVLGAQALPAQQLRNPIIPGAAIWLCEINPKTGEQLTESKLLWRGTGGRHPEGQWPVVNGGQAIDTLMAVKTLAEQQPRRCVTTPLHMVYIQNPIRENYTPVGRGWRLKAHGSLSENNQPTFLGRRQESADMTLETEIDTDNLDFGTEAGLTVYQIQGGHMDLALVKYQTGSVAVVMKYHIKSLQGEVMGEDSGLPLMQGKVRLRITSDGNQYHFLYACQGGPWKEVAKQDCSLVSTEVVGGFTGVTVGMYADGDGSATFSYFDYKEQQ